MKNFKTLFLILALGISLTACKEPEYIHVGSNWDALQKVEADKGGFKVESRAGSNYKLGERMDFSVKSEKSGHLWVVQVGPDDEVTLLFPNDKSSANKIKAGKWKELTPKGSNWWFEAADPAGHNIVAFFVTTGDQDYRDILEGNGLVIEKALRLVSDEQAWGLSKKAFNITKK